MVNILFPEGVLMALVGWEVNKGYVIRGNQQDPKGVLMVLVGWEVGGDVVRGNQQVPQGVMRG
jgi:hypothetical protein